MRKVADRPRPEAREGHAGRALAWSFTNTAVGRFGTLAIGIVLARLLGPAEFGTYAVAFVALMAILSFNDLGVSLAIVRWRDDPAEIAPTVTTISLLMSGLLTGLAVLVAPWFAEAMGDPSATPLVRWLSLCVLVNGLVATPAALLQRYFRQRERMVADQVNTWVGAFVSVGLALAGAGAASLVVGRLAGAGLSALLFLRYSPLPYRLGLDRAVARRLLSFGLPLAGASVIVFLVGFVDQLMVGRLLGPVLLGYYVLASNLANWPVSLFSQPLRSVAPALFARLQHDRDVMNHAWSQVLRLLSCVSLPVCVVIAVVATDLVQFVYGDVWAPAGPVLRFLAILAAVRIFFELSYDFLVVRGRSGAILWIQIAWILALVPGLWFGIERAGILGAAAALVAVSLAISLPMYVLEFRRSGIRLGAVVRAVRMPVLGALVTVGLATGIAALVPAGFATLALSGIAMAAVVAVLLHRFRADLAVFRTGDAS